MSPIIFNATPIELLPYNYTQSILMAYISDEFLHSQCDLTTMVIKLSWNIMHRIKIYIKKYYLVLFTSGAVQLVGIGKNETGTFSGIWLPLVLTRNGNDDPCMIDVLLIRNGSCAFRTIGLFLCK